MLAFVRDALVTGVSRILEKVSSGLTCIYHRSEESVSTCPVMLHSKLTELVGGIWALDSALNKVSMQFSKISRPKAIRGGVIDSDVSNSERGS